MFFMFHILAFTIYVSQINSFAIKGKNKRNFSDEKENGESINVEDAKRLSFFPTHKPMFQIIQNLTNAKDPNLKSNVFDKMLSDEMLSIKQHFYDKDMASTTPVLISTKTNIPTPTLEVKQMWPVIQFLSKSNEIEGTEYQNKNDSKINIFKNNLKENDHTLGMEIKNKESKNKVVELRSLSAQLDYDAELRPRDASYQNKARTICSCTKPSHFTTCTHGCTANIKRCTHSTKCEGSQECTRPAHSSYPALYVPFPSYFINGFTDAAYYSNTYYHPNILNDLKLTKKKKHRKTTFHYSDDDLYYDSNDNKDKANYYEYLAKDKNMGKRNKYKKGDVVINFDYNLKEKEKKSSPESKIKDDPVFHDVNKDKLINNIVDDLNEFYSDTVIKKCYCSSSSRSVFCYLNLCSLLIMYLYTLMKAI